jgi:hypothetical protein
MDNGGIFDAQSVLGLPTLVDDNIPTEQAEPVPEAGPPPIAMPQPMAPAAPMPPPAMMPQPYVPPMPIGQVAEQQQAPTPWLKYGLVAGALVGVGLGAWWLYSSRKPEPEFASAPGSRTVGTIE